MMTPKNALSIVRPRSIVKNEEVHNLSKIRSLEKRMKTIAKLTINCNLHFTGTNLIKPHIECSANTGVKYTHYSHASVSLFQAREKCKIHIIANIDDLY
jgi:hypothetical protein